MTDEPLAARVARVRALALSVEQAMRRRPGPIADPNAWSRVLRGPLTEKVVARFEENCGAKMPAAYRAFVRQVSAGGLGPGDGLLAIDDSLPASAARAGRAFRVQQDITAYADQDGGIDGTIQLTGDVRGGAFYLVMNGADAGSVQRLDPSGFLEAVEIDGQRADFLRWYEAWLDESLRYFEVYWSARRGAGDVTRAAAFPARWYRPLEDVSEVDAARGRRQRRREDEKEGSRSAGHGRVS